MLLRCPRCGNSEEFIILPHEYLYLTIADGEMEASVDEVYPGCFRIICDGCGYSEVEINDGFWAKFSECYETFLDEE